ncbi:hypothetical protein KJ641_00400 [Patescibacteria group bacterium]|nr:hypothetical protein [Patescibacteria group bacterium]MBU1895319.1 hypothetical protein [Patescibacteria group bacterium]
MHTQSEEQELRDLASKICSRLFRNNVERIVNTKNADVTTSCKDETSLNEFRVIANKHGHNVPISNIDLFSLVIRPLFLAQLEGGR